GPTLVRNISVISTANIFQSDADACFHLLPRVVRHGGSNLVFPPFVDLRADTLESSLIPARVVERRRESFLLRFSYENRERKLFAPVEAGVDVLQKSLLKTHQELAPPDAKTFRIFDGKRATVLNRELSALLA